MKIKTKITLWIGLLLFLIVLLTGMGVWSVSKIKKGTDHILASHHLSIQYAQDMQDALELSFYEKQAVQAFKVSLEKEKDVLSEIDMESPIGRIAQNFEKLQTDPEDKELIALVRRDIAEIIQTNMDAIVVKSNGASKMANTAMTRITLFGVVCFAVALLLVYSLPRSIAGPIAQLIEGTEEIARENYAYRIPIQEDGELRKLAQSFNAMASKLEEYEGINLSKLWTEKKRMETIIDSIDNPIIILDEYNQICFVNREALKIADLKITDILGINIQELAQTNIFIQLVIRDVFPTQLKKIEKKELKFYLDGQENYFEAKYLDLTIDAHVQKNSKKVGTLILLQNITSHKKLDIAKTNFIASLSHNFKTPISSSQIGLHLLRKRQTGQLNKEQRQLIDSIEEDIEKLLSITGDLLKISEVESENIQLTITTVDLREIINYAVSTIQRQAAQKSIHLQVLMPSEVPKIKGDAEKIAWVLINLISNARYSDQKATVQIRLENKERHLHLLVEDSGQGIPPEYKERIFSRYFRAPGTQEKGTGLGLAISREFMKAQGGSIEVESNLGKGSRFTVILKKRRER